MTTGASWEVKYKDEVCIGQLSVNERENLQKKQRKIVPENVSHLLSFNLRVFCAFRFEFLAYIFSISYSLYSFSVIFGQTRGALLHMQISILHNACVYY